MTFDIWRDISSEFKHFFDISPDLIFLMDLQGNLLDVNDTLLKALKFKNKKEIIDKPIFDILDKNQYKNEKQKKSFYTSLIKERSELEYILQAIKGEKIPVEGYSMRLNREEKELILCIARNVKDKKRLEEELSTSRSKLEDFTSKIPEIRLWSMSQKKEDLDMLQKSVELLKKSEKKYREIIESIIEGYFEIDLDGNITFFNQSLSKLLNIDSSELLGKNYKEFIAEDLLVGPESNEEGIRYKNKQIQITKKNEKRKFFETTISIKKDSNEHLVGYFGMIRDITQRKENELIEKKFREKLEEEVKRRTKELNDLVARQSLYLAEIIKASAFKSDFMARMSHELRTPLNAIIGFTELLLEGLYGKLNREQLEFLKDIKESSNLLLEMISKILDISKIESGKLELKIEKIKIQVMLNQINSLMITMLNQKELEFNIKLSNDVDEIYADPIRIKQILTNLLNNAVKFTLKGSITLEVLDEDDFWIFSVKDTGIGIAEKDKDLIFKEFQRIDSPIVNSIPGNGLGLALAKKLVNLHGGTIEFQSSLGKGSVFSFKIPKIIPPKV